MTQLKKIFKNVSRSADRFLLGCVPELYKKYVIESQGLCLDLQFLVVFRGMGHRCGYVQLPERMSAERDWGYEEVEEMITSHCPHGGVTFVGDLSEVVDEDDAQSFRPGTYVGFDANHGNDSADRECVLKYFPDTEITEAHAQSLKAFADVLNDTKCPFKIRTEEYMLEECVKLARGLNYVETLGCRLWK